MSFLDVLPQREAGEREHVGAALLAAKPVVGPPLHSELRVHPIDHQADSIVRPAFEDNLVAVILIEHLDDDEALGVKTLDAGGR